jgi:MinD-like ATPase involved in chromosome partitioning or flagellar assembly
MSERHAIAALAHPRAQWPTTLARWATSGAVPVELLTCLSSDELTAAFAAGRRLSAVLLDGASSRVDEHLVSEIRDCGAVPIGVHALDVPKDWHRLGVSSVLHADFERDDLVGMLDAVCGGDRPRERGTHGVTLSAAESHGTVIAVCGPGGCGASVVSMALAQGFAERNTGSSSVADDGTDSRILLVEGTRRAHQAMYHHTGDVIPGLPDLLARVRRGTVDAAELHEMTFGTPRGYRLLLGAPTLRESAAAGSGVASETLSTTARHNDVVVVDHDGDLPMGLISEALSGIAMLWVIVTQAGIKGLHESVRFTEEACNAGVPAKQVLVACNRVRRRDPARLAFPIEFSRITHGMGLDVAPVMILPEVRLEAAHRDVARLPRSIIRPAADRARRLIDQVTSPRELRDEQLLGAGTP